MLYPECIPKREKGYPFHVSVLGELKSIITFYYDSFTKLSDSSKLLKLKNDLNILQSYSKKESKELEKIIEISEYLALINCTISSNYDACRTNKKKIQGTIITHLKKYIENDCHGTIQSFSSIFHKGSAEFNLHYFSYLINSVSFNSDSFNKGDSDVLNTLLNCAFEEIDYILNMFMTCVYYWPEEQRKLEFISILLDTSYNLIETAKFDEVDGYLEKDSNYTNDTGIIRSEKGKRMKKMKEKERKILLRKGEGHYNLSIDDEVIIRNATFRKSAEKSYEQLDKKGIKIGIDYNKLNTYNPDILQISTYSNYPLVSSESNNTNPYFISIQLFKNGTEIPVKMKANDYIAEIYFPKTLLKDNYKTCVYYDERMEDLRKVGIETEINDDFIICKISHFSDFSVAENYNNQPEPEPEPEPGPDKPGDNPDDNNNKLKWWMIVIGIVGLIFIIGIVLFIIKRINKKKINEYTAINSVKELN